MKDMQKKTWFWNSYNNCSDLKSIFEGTSTLFIPNSSYEYELITTSMVSKINKEETSGVILFVPKEINEAEQVSAMIDYLELEGIVTAIMLDPLNDNAPNLTKVLEKATSSRFIVPLDSANEVAFNYYHDEAGHTWNKYMEYIRSMAKIVGEGKVHVHIFAGFGETEQQFARVCQLLTNMGARVIILSIAPDNSLGLKPCSIGKYRRLQVIRYLIDHHLSSINQIRFNEFGSVYDFGVHPRLLSNLLDDGLPFMDVGICGGISGTEYIWPGHDNGYQDMRNLSLAHFLDNRKKVIEQLTQISWEEEWQTLTRKFTMEKVDFSELEEDNDWGGVIKAGQLKAAGFAESDLRHLKN